MFSIISIDPGTDAGWGHWTADPPRLLSCGLGTAPSVGHTPDLLVIEIPRIYPGGGSKGADPQDLIKLAANAGRHVQRFPATPALAVYPQTWKGTLDKARHHRQVGIAIGPSNLAHAELCIRAVLPSKRHNVWDGVALGFWAVTQARVGARLGKDHYTAVKDMCDYVFRPL